MKKLFIATLILTVSSLIASAEDAFSVIVLEDGSVINAEYVEVGPKTIFYQESESQPLNKIDISKVLIVKYANGEKWVPGQATLATPAAELDPEQVVHPVVNYSNALANTSQKKMVSTENVTYLGKESTKEANTLALLFGPTDDSVIADEHLQLIVRRLPESTSGNAMLRSVLNPFASPTLQVEITNRSDKTVYVDLANTFIVINGNAHRFFENTSTTSMVSSTSGASVNLGAVAGAMGIGGAAGRIASGISVGGGLGQATTTTVFAERIQAIPPHSTKILEGVQFPEYGDPSKTGTNFGMSGDGYWKAKRYVYASAKEDMLKCGQVVTSPGVMRNFPEVFFTLDYSLEEGLNNTAKLVAKYVPQRLIGLKDIKELGPEKEPLIYLYLKPVKK
ncbi:MAG: hypothetical protein NC301_08375 [Bacteroides sp.]|nr:hypothetical protein [Bacteroides sp.]MCM1380183.1 hypothetical protein [Bacteroides sp.]MCM1446502.1 hypothetical protein [Prevotella sp.]